jgi:hypothetical protein
MSKEKRSIILGRDKIYSIGINKKYCVIQQMVDNTPVHSWDVYKVTRQKSKLKALCIGGDVLTLRFSDINYAKKYKEIINNNIKKGLK